jgi:signal transduction histidine kinase
MRRARTLLYLVAGLPLGIAGGAVLLAGWVVVAVLAITPLVVPALIGFRAATGGIAWLEARLANALLGTDLDPPTLSPATGFWGRAGAVARDEAFWRQQVHLLQGFVLRGALAVGELALSAAGAQAIALPGYYRWADIRIGSWHADTLPRALLLAAGGIAVLALALYLLGPLGALSRTLAVSLLRGEAPTRDDAVTRARRRHALVLHGIFTAAVTALVVVIWALTGRGYFWPEWPILALGLVLAIHACAITLSGAVAIETGIASALTIFFVATWALTGAHYFWPVWFMLAAGSLLAGHFLVQRRLGGSRRIAELESTRAGAVDAQDQELRRIERDLHDGAQARLVAIGMSLGMAEQKLASDPAAAQALLAEARQGTHEALEELRDLARGIHPPVLADRGLEAAIQALAARSPLDVHLSVDLPDRPRPAAETAAYFVVAESLANTGKHAQARKLEIDVHRRNDTLVVKVVDDGRGGADPNGSGLRGLRGRVEALDGTLAVTSPEGGPTAVEAVIPCAW